MIVLLNDGMETEGIDILTNSGLDVSTQKLDLDELVRRAGEYDAIVVRSATQVTKEVIEAGSAGRLKLVARAGVGYDNIEIAVATKNGILVKNAPNGNTNAAAELAHLLMLAVSRNIVPAYNSLVQGQWSRRPYTGIELTGKTLGVIGCGRVGQRLAELVTGYRMDVIGYDPFVRHPQGIRWLPIEEVVASADYVSIHAGGEQQVMTAELIGLMKPTAYLINTARAANVDDAALYAALFSRKIAGAGFDVHNNEPERDGTVFTSRYAGLTNVIMTPHLGASTIDAQVRTSIETATAVRDFLLEGDFAGAVNAGSSLEAEGISLYPLFVYHADMPGAFAAIDNVLAGCGINIRETRSRQLGPGNALAVYMLHDPATSKVIERVLELNAVFRVTG